MTKKVYKNYDEATQEILDSIKVGDLIKISDWAKPYRVIAISKNHIIMTAKRFKDTYYSIFSKIPADDNYNNMEKGFFYAGSLQWGIIKSYDWNSKDSMQEMLNDLEDPKVEDVRMSRRQGTISIHNISIKEN